MVRRIQINVFQTVLLLTVRPNEIKRLNTDYQDLSSLHSLDVDAEIDRALAVAMPCVDSDSHQIHIVAEPLDVACNFAAWNREMQTESGQQLWAHRRIRKSKRDISGRRPTWFGGFGERQGVSPPRAILCPDEVPVGGATNGVDLGQNQN